MSKYTDEAGYNVGVQFPTTRPGLTPQQVRQVQIALNDPRLAETTYPQLTVDQNDFRLADGILHRFTTNALRTITGFANVGVGINVIVNVGGNDLVLANNSASSLVQNRILTHTGANVTLNPGESALIVYDRTSSRSRTIGFV